MKLILLAGNGLSNKKWIEDIEHALKPLFGETYVQYYKHWETGGKLIDLNEELSRLQDLTKNFSEHTFFAKSAGTLLVLKGVKEGKLKPSRCIFVGTAIGWGRAEHFDVDLWLENYSIPTLFIQKSFDPACSYHELEELLKDKNAKNFSLEETEGNDHSYNDMETLKDVVKNFVL
jgi:hypothetical protein